ncbi:MAG TPA: alpha/beta fold hydrolase [Blastocatellia bacterium]|nr:alpha/beta fold hydrolase [Blastocatellia bacterium]
MNHSVIILLILTILTGASPAQGSQLPRQSYWGAAAAVNSKGPGAVIRRVSPGSPAEKAGLKPADVILRVNGKELTDQPTYSQIVKSSRAGEAVTLEVSRAGQMLTLQLVPARMPKEVIKGVEVIHDSVVTEPGHRVRTIVTRPENRQGRLPAILLIPWLSCDSVEWPLGAPFGLAKFLQGLAEKSGYVLMRVDKPGIGDSEGPDCSKNDLHTDMAAFRAALQALKKYDFVDTNNIYLLGASLGGALAPVIAQGENIRGIIITGGFAKTWHEHMIDHERTRLELTGMPAGEINTAMRGYIEFYSAYLNQKLMPGEVIRQRPHLAKLWYDEPWGQYGRPAAFYHQVQELNVEGAWQKVSAPVLIVYGEYDWIMSRADHELVARIVNKQRPGSARLVILPKTNHSLDVYESMEKTFKGEGAQFDAGVTSMVIDWLKSIGETGR